MRIGSVNDPQALIAREMARIKHHMGNLEYEDWFYIVHIGKNPDLILGTPWMEKFCPDLLAALKRLGDDPPKTHFSPGGEGGEIAMQLTRLRRLLENKESNS